MFSLFDFEWYVFLCSVLFVLSLGSSCRHFCPPALYYLGITGLCCHFLLKNHFKIFVLHCPNVSATHRLWFYCFDHQVVICGGGAKPPIVKKAIGDFLPSSSFINSIPEDEIIAIGAAKEVIRIFFFFFLTNYFMSLVTSVKCIKMLIFNTWWLFLLEVSDKLPLYYGFSWNIYTVAVNSVCSIIV